MKREIFYAIVCEVSGICGAFVSKKEAKEYQSETGIILCPAKHRIVKCKIKLNNK